MDLNGTVLLVSCQKRSLSTHYLLLEGAAGLRAGIIHRGDPWFLKEGGNRRSPAHTKSVNE